jgi:hypothetical protein
VSIDASIPYDVLLRLLQGLAGGVGRGGPPDPQAMAPQPPPSPYPADPSRLEPPVIPGGRPPIGPGRAGGLFGLIQPAESAEDPQWAAMRELLRQQGAARPGIVVGAP